MVNVLLAIGVIIIGSFVAIFMGYSMVYPSGDEEIYIGKLDRFTISGAGSGSNIVMEFQDGHLIVTQGQAPDIIQIGACYKVVMSGNNILKSMELSDEC